MWGDQTPDARKYYTKGKFEASKVTLCPDRVFLDLMPSARVTQIYLFINSSLAT
jgi:hypothetical protein